MESDRVVLEDVDTFLGALEVEENASPHTIKA